MMKNFERPPVRIRQIEGIPPQFAGNELARLATTYAEVFAGNPWREVSRCVDGFSSEPAARSVKGVVKFVVRHIP